MKYSSIYMLITLGTAASALAAAAPQQHKSSLALSNVTAIEKNQAFPAVGPLLFEDCRDSDCTPGED